MKRIFFLIAMSCMMLAQLPVQAQSMKNRKALLAAIDTIVRKYSHEPAHQDIIEENIKAFEKDADFIASIARCYYNYAWVEREDGSREQKFGTREPEKAYKYIYRALHMDTTCVQAYLVAADIEENELRHEEAGEWYKKGIAQCPNSQDLAIAFSLHKARDNMDDAIEELKKKGQSDPNFKTDLEIARLYLRMEALTGQPSYIVSSAQYFLKCNLSDLTENDLQQFLIGLSVTQHWQEAKPVAERGTSLYPESFVFAKYYYQSLVNLKEWEGALKAYNNMKKTPKYKLDQRDEAYLGNVYRGLKRYDDAMEQYERVINAEDKSGVSIANNGIKSAMDEQVKAFMKEKRFDEAAAFYQKFVDRRQAEGKMDATIWGNYAGIFLQQSLELTGEEKIPVLRKAGNILDEWIAIETYANNKSIALEQRQAVESEIYKVDESNRQNLLDQYKRQIDFVESLKDEEKTSGVMKRYEATLGYYYNDHVKVFLNTKSVKDKNALKEAGEYVKSKTSNQALIDTINEHFTVLKIK
jgi:tetratricopeptide (TPR) repeat protein